MNITRKTKYVFCVSPGRSGTNYLYHVVSCANDVCAVHEPEHQYAEYARLRPQRWDLKNSPFSSSYRMRRELKLAQISDSLSRSNADVYVETNPLFCTLWSDVILDALSSEDLIVIILRRNASEVLKSLLDLGWFTTKDGNAWMVTAYSVNSLVRPVMPEKHITPPGLILSHLLNVELYAQRIKRRCEESGHKVIELHSNEMFGNYQLITDLMSRFGLVTDHRKLEAVIQRRMSKVDTKQKKMDVPQDGCVRMIQSYQAKCAERGVIIPELQFL